MKRPTALPSPLLLRSSHGDVSIDAKGFPIEPVPPRWVKTRFDLDEFRKWEVANKLTPDFDETDILLLGYWTEQNHFIPPDKNFRKDYVALTRRREQRGT